MILYFVLSSVPCSEQLQADLGEKAVKQLKKKTKKNQLDEEKELIRKAMEYEEPDDEEIDGEDGEGGDNEK